jgi:non-ribosomal peptide synthetase-like protein
MTAIFVTTIFAIFVGLAFVAWRQYLWAAEDISHEKADDSPYGLTDVFGDNHLVNVPHQKGIQWLTDVFSRSAKKFPDHTALQIPHTGESLTYAELDARAEKVADAVAPFITGADQIVAVAMSQDNWQIVASHLGILKAGATVMFLDTTLPEDLITHMLNDARPVVILTRGEERFRDLPTLDVMTLPDVLPRRKSATWLDDPTQRLATIFYTSGTTGMPKGVECPHAGYVNLALSYADYFDLVPGMDATSLTSSLGYDGSISEMYSAWVSGCAVVMLTKDEIRSGPELVDILRDAEVTVLFCPPVLLTTLTADPATDLPYPICRYIVPAGEAFPNTLVEPWTRNRRQIINTYGPTEASTDTSRQSLRPGETITIGSPFANVTYVILEIDELNPLPHGQVGELCIGGVHVARGYRNLPEQTAAKFIDHPKFGRLYRTGDKCRIDITTQRVHFLGRIDAQLKVRGHRVEAQAVEDILQTQFGEIEAAVLDYQNEALVAFVAAPSIRKNDVSIVARAPAEWASRVTERLAKQLPAPSVPTQIFLVEKFDMKGVSGKIDRKSLPNLSQILKAPALEWNDSRVTASIANGDGREVEHDEISDSDCAEVLAICQSVFETPIGLDDGFAEAGGHSIVIARLAYKLRSAGWPIPVRALLSDCNTARKIATHPRAQFDGDQDLKTIVPQAEETIERDEAAARVLPVRWFTFLQVLFAALVYLPAIVGFLLFFGEADDGSFLMTAGLTGVIVVSLLFFLLVLITPFVFLAWAMVIKYCMGGDIYKNNVTPGVYPKWSRMHLRIWCITRLETSVMTPFDALYRSAPTRAFMLRQLGTTIGKNLQSARDAVLSGPLDLISIGDDVAIQSAAYIQTTSWFGQHFRVGPVRLEDGCKISMRAAVANNVTVGKETWIAPFTPILDSVGECEVWEGSPARLAGRCTKLKRTAKACEYKYPIWFLETANVLMQGFFSIWLNALPIAVIFFLTRGWFLSGNTMYGDHPESATFFEIIWPLILCGFVTTWLTIVVTSLLGCIFIRLTAASPGLYPSHGIRGALLMYRMNKLNTIQRQWTWTITGQYLRAIAGVRFPRVGASECDVMFNLVPETASADSQVFWSSGSFTNMLDYGAEYFTLRRLDMPRNFFTGNNCLAEYGQFPANFLLGVSTPCSEIQYRRQMWSRAAEPVTVAGNPPMEFPSTSLAEENGTPTRPGFGLFLTRVLMNDMIGLGLQPITEGVIFAILYLSLSELNVHPVVGALAALLLTETGLVLLSVSVKKVLVGRWGTDHRTPFWSLRHFAYFFAQDCFFVWCREPLRFFAGTTIANSILGMFGSRIGSRTIIAQPMQCFDWNAVNFGNDCYIDGFLQLHTFEDMTLKVKRTNIQDGCTVNVGATVMSGAVIAPESNLLPLSLVLKEFRLPTATYEGSPAEPVGGSFNSLPRAASDLDFEPAFDDADVERSRFVDRTDWLKLAAIIFVTIDHFGYFFVDNDRWWSVFGRMAAPSFFFLMGYAQTRKIPVRWIFIGIFLTLLDSSNNEWKWVAPNILLSFVLIRLALPYARMLLEKYSWAAFVVVAVALYMSIPVAAKVFDYGAEGWLWALFGLSQRIYVDSRSREDSNEGLLKRTLTSSGLLRLAACILAAAIYVGQEQTEFKFNLDQSRVFIFGLTILTVFMCLFWRGPSRFQPPAVLARPVQFIGRNTLAIYAITLAAFELIVKFFPDLAA